MTAKCEVRDKQTSSEFNEQVRNYCEIKPASGVAPMKKVNISVYIQHWGGLQYLMIPHVARRSRGQDPDSSTRKKQQMEQSVLDEACLENKPRVGISKP